VRANTVSPGPVETDLWLGDHGVAATVGGANASDPRAVDTGGDILIDGGLVQTL
jgi:NAD(P)-dependent dehydrogenase (short-subunit alcohol dehydrogenase family)